MPTSASCRPSPIRATTRNCASATTTATLKPPTPQKRIETDASETFWIDYVADVGDGFEATYTTAYLLAQDSLDIQGAGKLPHGDVLIMGGDQCYPQATREEYKKRLLEPFNWAFSVPEAKRKLFAIPGNHDWYDGLIAFDSLFCSSRDKLSQAKGNIIGGWQCQQHRSYWALRLPHNWWIWGADIQFSKYLDTAQVNYFEAMANQMEEGHTLIICLAQPSWMIADLQGLDEEENFFKITSIARAKGAHIAAVIAGDWHHYNRYYANELDVHFVTSGGGSAFLHPTHILKNNVSVRWPEKQQDANAPEANAPGVRQGERWEARRYDMKLRKNTRAADTMVDQAVQDVQDVLLEPLQDVSRLRRRRAPLPPQATKCYPSKARSYLLSLGNVLFPFYNPGFAVGIGLLYWFITWQFQSLVSTEEISLGKIDKLGIETSLWEVLPLMPLYLLQGMITSVGLTALLVGLLATLIWYVDAIDRPGFRRYATKVVVGTVHFLAHLSGNVHPVASGRYLEQQDVAQHRALRGLAEPNKRPAAHSHQGVAGNLAAQGRSAGASPARNSHSHACAPDRRLHVLPDPDGRAGRPHRRLSLGLLLGADRTCPHARRRCLRGAAHQGLQELPAPEVRTHEVDHLPPRHRQGAGPGRLAQRAALGRQPAPQQSQAGGGQAHRRALDRSADRDRAPGSEGGIERFK